MDKIVIFGFSGAGKSTLARRLGEILGIEPTYMDSINWLPGWVEDSNENRIKKLLPILKRDRWIIEGNYKRTLWHERLEKSDTIIFMDINRFKCFYRVVKRRIQYRGKTRPDMGTGCNEKLDFEFAKWVLIDGRKKRKNYYDIIRSLKNKDVYIFKNTKQVDEFVKQLERKYKI